MEILHSDAKRTIIAALDQSTDGDVYTAHLSNDFNVVRTSSAARCLEIMTERYADLSAVIIDINMAEENDFAFLRTVADERRFDTIPVLIGSRRQIDESDMRCLDEGAFDFILPPHHLKLTKRRIENAVRMKRATTFYEIEAILRQLPSNIFLKDTQGRYVFMTHYWHHLDMEGDPEVTVRGKTDYEIRRDVENVAKAVETDREVIRTGKGTSYILESNVDGVHDFMKLIKEPVFDEDGNVIGVVALINDVTETELLKRELQKRAHTDEMTGLENRRAFYEYVGKITEDSSFPFAVISADCDRLKVVNDTYGHLVGDEYIRAAATLLKSCLPETARIYRLGGDEFTALLPATTLDQANGYIEKMRSQFCDFKFPDVDIELSISYGSAILESTDDIETVIGEADRAMYEDKAARVRGRAE